MLITPNTYPYQVLHVLRKRIIVGADRRVKTNKFQFFMFANKELKELKPAPFFFFWSIISLIMTCCSCVCVRVCVCVCVTNQSDGVLWPQHSEHGLKMFLEVT